MENKSLLKLVNPEFDFEFDGVSYHLRKATLDKAVLYQQKIKELKDDPAFGARIIAYCIFIMLRDQLPELTEDIVMTKVPADANGIEVLTVLGFMNPSIPEQVEKATGTQ